MRLSPIKRLLGIAVAACALALVAAGCSATGESGGGSPPVAQESTPAPPRPCATEPPGTAQDGSNDEQGGSTPGVDPCDGPGN